MTVKLMIFKMLADMFLVLCVQCYHQMLPPGTNA